MIDLQMMIEVSLLKIPNENSLLTLLQGIQAKAPPINDYTSLPGPSLLKQTLGLQNRQHGQYLGQTSEYDVRLINLSPFNGRGEYVSMPGTLRRVSQNVHFIMKSESPAEVDEELANL